jgi:hypothetical protein
MSRGATLLCTLSAPLNGMLFVLSRELPEGSNYLAAFFPRLGCVGSFCAFRKHYDSRVYTFWQKGQLLSNQRQLHS